MRALIADASGYVPEEQRGAFERWAGLKVRTEPGWSRDRYELLAERWNEGANVAALASFEGQGLDALEREQWEAGALWELAQPFRDDLELGPLLDAYRIEDADELRRELEAGGMNVAKELGKMRAKETKRRANPATEADRLISELFDAAARWSERERASDPAFYSDPDQAEDEPDPWWIGEGIDGFGVVFGEETELPLRKVGGALEARPPGGDWARVRSVRDVEALLWPATRRKNPAMVTKKTSKKAAPKKAAPVAAAPKKAAPVAAAPKKRRKVKRAPKPAAKGKRRLPGQASVDAREFSALTAAQRSSVLEVLRREGRGAPVVRSNPAPGLNKSQKDRLKREVLDMHATARALRRIWYGVTAEGANVAPIAEAADELDALGTKLRRWMAR